MIVIELSHYNAQVDKIETAAEEMASVSNAHASTTSRSLMMPAYMDRLSEFKALVDEYTLLLQKDVLECRVLARALVEADIAASHNSDLV